MDLVMETTRRCVKSNTSAIANLRILVLLYSDVVVRKHVLQPTISCGHQVDQSADRPASIHQQAVALISKSESSLTEVTGRVFGMAS
jgi:hypothetical protein